MKPLVPHLGALVVAVLCAFSIWSRGDKPDDSKNPSQVEIWSGSTERLQRVLFESPRRTVTIEPRKDSNGRFYVVTVDKEESKSPHAKPDAGPPATPEKRVVTRFIGVKQADELAAKLAPLNALREVGPLASGRAEEFGFDKPEGTLKVKVGGTEQMLVIGGGTPGGSERYAKREPGGTVYAIAGDLASDMTSAESRLLERAFHAFADGDVTKLRIARSGKTREVVSMADKKGAWADAAEPSKLDETVGNWLTKISRLNLSEYVETPASPLTPESAIVRIEYVGGTKALGFFELYKLPGEKGNDYLIRTENTRWYAKVLSNAAEAIETDAASVAK